MSGQWPPLPGDLWRDAAGDLWFALLKNSGEVRLKCVVGDGPSARVNVVWSGNGPLTLVHREPEQDGATS